jgi:serine/threonine protein kinase
MKPLNWERLQEIFHEALALDVSERLLFIANACAGDSSLERLVKSLLSAHVQPAPFDVPIAEFGAVLNTLVGQPVNDRYLVEAALGRGGMGRVYLARDRKLNNQPVVLKIIAPHLVADRYARQKFDQEVEALSRINHQNVVRVTDRGELSDGTPYIVMQYVDGQTLRTQITDEGMNPGRAACIIEQIGLALDHVHSAKVFHRDLKPANIMLRCNTDSVVLIDFGIARILNSDIAGTTVNQLIPGTLPYMSPEQLRGEKVTTASDVYSMGVVAFEMVTGRLPFNSKSPAELLELQQAGDLKSAARQRGLSREAEAIINSALSVDIGSRPKTAGEFGKELAKALRKEVSVPTGGPLNRRHLLMAIAVVFILATAALIALYKYRSKPSIVLPTRQLTYFITVQRMRGAQEYEAPDNSNDDDDKVFARGDKFQLTVNKTEPGYLYIFNEGPAETNDTNFWMVYPNAATNNGAATIGADQAVQSNWITFRGPKGSENFWIVWSVSPVDELEDVKSKAFRHAKGGLTGSQLIAVKEFLRIKHQEAEVRVTRYKDPQTAVVRGKRDFLVTLAKFNHR